MNKLSIASIFGLAGALAVLTGPVSAGPAAGNAALHAAVPLTITMVRHRVSPGTQESTAEHRRRCWVVRDAARNFGYFKC
jgi:hypothetical protein